MQNRLFTWRYKTALLIFLQLCSCFLYSQNRISYTANNGWYMYFGNHKLSENFSLHTEYQWRRNELIKNWQQSLTRIGLDYHIANNVSLTAGYAFITTWPYGEQPVNYHFNEHRAWQQLVMRQSTGRFYFNHRYRMEQRWLETKKINNEGDYISDEFIYRNRARYRIMLNIPMFKKELKENTWFLSFYNETFISFGKNVAKNIFDQNRIYGALGYMYNKNVNIQLGYMYHSWLKADAILIENNHNLQIGITYNLEKSSKKD